MAFLRWLLLSSLLMGCTSLFFQPTKNVYPYIFIDQLPYQDLHFTSADGTKLHAWYIPSVAGRARYPEHTHYQGPTRGLIVQFHGNAENMTSHYRGLAWLLFEGYDVLTFDYRGYGQSFGERSLDGIFADSQAALNFAVEMAEQHKLPLIAYGQSLGGSLLLRALSNSEPIPHLQAVVIESSFNSYQQIAREKFQLTWLTWPLQWLPWLLISDRYAPGTPDLRRISPIPVVLIYSEKDPVVPAHHGRQLFSQLHEPKELWLHSNEGHINAMWVEQGKYRRQLVAFFESHPLR